MRQALVPAGAAVAIAAVAVTILASGKTVQPYEPVPTAAIPADEPDEAAPPSRTRVAPPSRAIDPATLAAPAKEDGGLERVEPRGALSPLSLALPPKPKKPDEWGGTVLFHPVATGAGTLEAKGYSIVIAGIDPVPLDQTCDSGGKSWPCGVRARAEFRALLRGRAVSCVIPPEADRAAIVAECRVGKRDIGAWLVENGWARTSAKGRFAEIGKKARADEKGIFGAAPNVYAPPAPTAESALPSPPTDPIEPFPRADPTAPLQ